MDTYTIPALSTSANAGISGERALANYFHIAKNSHDSVRYDAGDDMVIASKHVSVKTPHFTLMAGNLCQGLTTFDEIWNLYESTVHSDTFALITKSFRVYEMNLAEFKQFVYAFCVLEHESTKNGGGVKIRCRRESTKMLQWLQARVA